METLTITTEEAKKLLPNLEEGDRPVLFTNIETGEEQYCYNTEFNSGAIVAGISADSEDFECEVEETEIIISDDSANLCRKYWMSTTRYANTQYLNGVEVIEKVGNIKEASDSIEMLEGDYHGYHSKDNILEQISNKNSFLYDYIKTMSNRKEFFKDLKKEFEFMTFQYGDYEVDSYNFDNWDYDYVLLTDLELQEIER